MSGLGLFSEREDRIIRIIGRGKKTLAEIANDLFIHEHPADRPFDVEISVGNAVRRIIKKCEHHKLEWTLKKNRSEGKMYITKETV